MYTYIQYSPSKRKRASFSRTRSRARQTKKPIALVLGLLDLDLTNKAGRRLKGLHQSVTGDHLDRPRQRSLVLFGGPRFIALNQASKFSVNSLAVSGNRQPADDHGTSPERGFGKCAGLRGCLRSPPFPDILRDRGPDAHEGLGYEPVA